MINFIYIYYIIFFHNFKIYNPNHSKSKSDYQDWLWYWKFYQALIIRIIKICYFIYFNFFNAIENTLGAPLKFYFSV